jgi:hypothetical protein
MNLKGFIKECHKKEVFKMLSIYLVSSWVLLQVITVIAEPIGLPRKSVTYLIVILLIGFPIYIYYLWKFKLLKYEIQQTEDPNTPYNKSAFQKMYFSSLFVVGIISGISIILIAKKNFSNNLSLEKNENNKIAVLEFENTTGNEKLNNVGKIASNWIIHGITENQIAQVISPKLVNDYTSILKSNIPATDLNELIKNYFNPGKVIEGVYYEENNKLLLQGSIKDGLNDKTLISFETITCNSDSPLDCAEKLKQEILGYLSTVGKQDELGYIQNVDNKSVSSYYEETPPNYEAYQYLLNALENENNGKLYLELLNKSINKDPDFFEPKIHKISYYYNNGNFKIADSLRKAISINSKLNSRQRNWMLFYEAILSGKNDKVNRAIKDEYNNAYKDLSTNMTTMTIALQYVNRPEDIEAIYDEISMKDLVLENCSRCGYRYYLKGLADVELGNYANVIETLLPITNIIEDNYLKRPIISAFVRLGRYRELEKYLSDYELIASPQDINYLKVFTGIQLINSDQIEESNKYFNEIILSKNSALDSANLAQAFYFKNDYLNAKNLYKKLLENDPNNFDYLVRLAISEYKSGDKADAKVYIQKLDSLRTDYQFGSIDYSRGQYFAAIGDQDEAIKSLIIAVAQGFNYTPSTFQNDPHFKTIKGRPEFSEQILNYWRNKKS